MTFRKRLLPRSLNFVVITLFVLGICQASQGTRSDSVVTTAVEPGVTHLSIFRDGPNRINVLIIDLKAKNLRVTSFRPVGLVPTTVQAARNDGEGHRVVGAINADFFSFTTGWPVSNQIVDGQFVLGASSVRTHLLIDRSGKPRFEKVSFDGWLKTKGSKTYQINGVNDAHRNSAIILHTSYSDSATRQIAPGKAIPLRLLNSSWSVGDTLRMLVGGEDPADLLHIRAQEAVLWIGGAPSVWGLRDELRTGDTILVYLGFQPALRGIATAVGGMGMIVSDGKFVEYSTNLKERTSYMFLRARHPRTFVGIDRDTAKIFLCTVDGRQATSVGMNYQEMADFLLSIGVWHATNLDGGGSTTMVVRGKIVNSPSDKTGERPVANSLQILRIAPASNSH
jgi:hypothetical protein